MSSVLDRRDLLKILTATAFKCPLQLTAAGANKHLYFTDEDFTLLDVLTEHIIPRDSHSPGAHDAGVAAFIDKTVAEAFLPEDKESWIKGFVEINRLSVENNKRAFLKIGKKEQVAILQKLAQAEHDPKTEGEKFFAQLKNTAAFAYYSSDIGIHQEMEYKGNVILEQFAGYDAV